MSDKVKLFIERGSAWVAAHSRVVMPAVLVVCVAVTVAIAVNARNRDELESAKAAEEEIAEEEGIEVITDFSALPEIPMEVNAYPEVNQLIHDFYAAREIGDSEMASTMRRDIDDLGMIHIEALDKYIEDLTIIDIYTKPGLTEGSFDVYVIYEATFKEIDTPIPGLSAYYVLPDEYGQLAIKKTVFTDDKKDYINAIRTQENVIDLENKINAEYADILANDKELEEYLAFLFNRVLEEVGVVLAQIQQPDITADNFREDEAVVDNGEVEVSNATRRARTTTIVNIRSSDSETADRIDSAMSGQEVTVLEQKGNGWSRINHQGRDAYIKTEFLEFIDPPPSGDGEATIGRIKVLNGGVRVRSTPSTSGDVLGTVQIGNRFDLVEEMTNGWSKIKYNNSIGYIRSDFVEKE